MLKFVLNKKLGTIHCFVMITYCFVLVRGLNKCCPSQYHLIHHQLHLELYRPLLYLRLSWITYLSIWIISHRSPIILLLINHWNCYIPTNINDSSPQLFVVSLLYLHILDKTKTKIIYLDARSTFSLFWWTCTNYHEGYNTIYILNLWFKSMVLARNKME